MFYQSVLQLFVHFNKLLQREDPIIYMLSDEINHFLKNSLGNLFLFPPLKEHHLYLKQTTIIKLNSCQVKYTIHVLLPSTRSYKNNFFDFFSLTIIDSELHIGLMTRQLLNKLEDEGDITHREVRVFHNAVRNFLTTATAATYLSKINYYKMQGF